MNLYEALTLVHIVAAVVLLGGSLLGSPAVRAAVRRARTTAEMRAYFAIGRPLPSLEPAAAIVVLATGIYLTTVANFWAIGWVQVSLALWLFNTVLELGFVKPAMTRVEEALAASPEGPVTAELDTLRRSPRWSHAGDGVPSNDFSILCLMVVQPASIATSIAVAVAVNLAVIAFRFTWRAASGGGRYAGMPPRTASS
jgi:uncharacterized membrane protein